MLGVSSLSDLSYCQAVQTCRFACSQFSARKQGSSTCLRARSGPAQVRVVSGSGVAPRTIRQLVICICTVLVCLAHSCNSVTSLSVTRCQHQLCLPNAPCKGLHTMWQHFGYFKAMLCFNALARRSKHASIAAQAPWRGRLDACL